MGLEPTVIRTADLATFLVARGITAPIIHEEYLPDLPDQVVRLLAVGGPGTAVERAFDRAAVQVLVRGNQLDMASAEALATQVDQALLGAPFPVRVGGRYVAKIDYLGSLPAHVGADGDRTVMACSYVLQIARD